MTHIAEMAPNPCPKFTHATVDEALGCNRCYDASTAKTVRKLKMQSDGVEAVQNLFERAVQWIPWSLTTQDAADFGDELRADRDLAIGAIRGWA